MDKTPFSAIIVLAHLMDEHAHLNSESRARMDKAVEAYRNKEASIILTTGWPTTLMWPLPSPR